MRFHDCLQSIQRGRVLRLLPLTLERTRRAAHQIHQFLVFTNSDDVKITHALVENTTKKQLPGFQDFGEINLTGNGGHGYIRLDWFNPDALPTWGDGRLFILGDKGFIEIRKYTDLAKSESGNH